MKKIFFLMIVFFQIAAMKNVPTHEEMSKIKRKISRMAASDQLIRFEILNLHKNPTKENEKILRARLQTMQQIDRSNSREIKKIISKWGWPKKQMFGQKSCQEFWLLTQHADKDLEFQKQALQKLKQYTKQDKTELKHYAYLYDRVLINQQKPQLYGTQGHCTKDYTWQHFPLVNSHDIDYLRKSMGLIPFEAYKKKMNALCLKPQE